MAPVSLSHIVRCVEYMYLHPDAANLGEEVLVTSVVAAC